MKIFKRILLLLAVFVTVIVIYNYPKLNMIAGYAAKNASSSVFVANRTLEFTNKTDNNFSPINLADSKVDEIENWATSSVFGLLSRKAFYKEGIGTVLALDDEDLNKYDYP